MSYGLLDGRLVTVWLCEGPQVLLLHTQLQQLLVAEMRGKRGLIFNINGNYKVIIK